jgi:predicted phosphodiesterase
MHPVAGLKHFIAREGIKADMLLCPGDVANKADPAALKYGWNALVEIGSLLGVGKQFFATAGNHDMDSRYIHNDYDAKGMLQSLQPPFPGLDEAGCDRYWARNFAIVEGSFWRLVLLNSSAYHGGGKNSGGEAQHGRVSQRTLAALKRELSSSVEKPLNILLCHHHPVRDNAISETDYSEMEGGDQLLHVLDGGTSCGHWLIVHGHKHHPKLGYASGGSGSAIIFSAGSLSAELYTGLADRARNQFYIIRLPVTEYQALSLDIGGQITAWDWIPLAGWQKAGPQSGLPHQSGFGCRSPLSQLAKELATHVANSSYMQWSELTAVKPELAFMLPSDIRTVCRRLETQFGIRSVVNDAGVVSSLALTKSGPTS